MRTTPLPPSLLHDIEDLLADELGRTEIDTLALALQVYDTVTAALATALVLPPERTICDLQEGR